ncbi:MAG TPA: flagellar hook-associated protein FlgL [Thermotogota bacterium]|nr:flagellar hook-associated protein FlgL [Thermotogota bacterium]HPJ88379.1 flagellar hook-associated protein FlgL [Thermotogota bacterium]HPR95453.1 flagellar hook-associated protein FlgL [Thermotogota bacterium]
MRINHTMLHNKILQDITNDYKKVARLHEEGTTGLKVIYPSDDAIVATRASNANSRVREMEQYKRNGNTVSTYLDLYDSVTQEMSSLATNIRELTVKGANDSMTPTDRESIAQEIDKIKDHMIQLANTNVGGEYIFAGADAANPPVADDGTITMETKANVKQSTNLGGYSFSYGVTVYDEFVVDGNESVFNLLENISENLMEDNPESYLNDIALEKLERFEYNLQRMTSENGSSQKFLEMSVNRFEEYTNFLTDYVSKEQDADFLETYTNLTNQQTILDAALKTGSSVMTKSLVDFVS